VICPHCNTQLKRKERTGQRCSRCKRQFALDPKDNTLMLHDARLRKLIDKLSDGGELRYTGTQLWYAAARKPLQQQGGSGWGCGCVLVLSSFVALPAVVTASGGNPFAIAGLVVVIALLAVLIVRRARNRPIAMPMPRDRFSTAVIANWRRVYGTNPPGLVNDLGAGAVSAPQPPHPAAALLCPDRSITACLAANDVPGRLNLALANEIRALPAGVPVLVVHDASVDGCRFAVTARHRLAGRRVSIVGLRPHRVRSAKGAIRLRTRKVDKHALRELRASGWLDAGELTWLAKGWSVPVAPVPPAKLIEVITRATRREADRRRARTVGFMTWPAR
jgi:hypothetical protein